MTTQATHTPRPWTVSIERDKYDSSRDVIRVHAEEDRNHPQGPLTVARVNQHLADESIANARLIAVAPDLLEALRGSVEWLRTLREENEAAVIESAPDGFSLCDAEAIIAKAEGRAGE